VVSTGDTLKRNIALVAHDNKKADLVEWTDFNKGTLALHNLYATGDTEKKTMEKTSLKITLLKGGSYGGDIEIGALIANEKLDYLISFGIRRNLFLMMSTLKPFSE